VNIVVINNLARFPGTERWDFDLVRYEDFIDHAAHRVHYIVNARGRAGVLAPPGRYTLTELPRLDDIAAYRPVLRGLRQAHGAIDRLIVFSESLQDLAAALREEFDIPGKRPPENRLGRDKLVMKQKVAAAGLRTPRFTAATAAGVERAATFAADAGYPVILKPVNGQSSQGVRKIADEAELRVAVADLPEGGHWDLEEYIDGTLLHIDGLVDPQGRVTFAVPSRYVNTCLDFTLGAPLGAVMLEPGTALHVRVCEFSAHCIEAIGLQACPFHLELFHTPAGELVFLEVGARVGGADVPSVIHRATGVNLFAEWVNMSLGQPATLSAATRSVGAWLMFPRPAGLPLRVTSVTRFDKTQLPTLWRQLVPRPGQLLEHEDGYCSMQSGRFLFDAAGAGPVVKDVERVLNEFSITTAQP
jgi:hypothetical protein